MAPITVAFGPSASYNLLSAAVPGLLCYGAYRVASLWLPSQAGAVPAGWPGNLPGAVMPAGYRVGTMPTTMPALDRPIASDHSGPIVVEFPFGICGGTPTCGAQFAPEAQVLATADGHPRAVGFIARVPAPTLTGIKAHALYAGLVRIWQAAARNSPAEVAAARLDARAMNVGWVLVWPQQHAQRGKPVRYFNPGVTGYLRQTGVRFAYQADGVLVYQVASPVARHENRLRPVTIRVSRSGLRPSALG